MSDKGRAFINIENVVASATLKQQIDLNAIVRVFPGVEYRPEQFPGLVYRLKKPKTASLKKTMYEPEQFPGLIYRMDEPKVVILLFASGKLVCTGAKREIQVGIAVNKLQQILELKNLIFYEGTEKPRLPPLPAKELEKERLKVELAKAKLAKEKTEEKDEAED